MKTSEKTKAATPKPTPVEAEIRRHSRDLERLSAEVTRIRRNAEAEVSKLLARMKNKNSIIDALTATAKTPRNG